MDGHTTNQRHKMFDVGRKTFRLVAAKHIQNGVWLGSDAGEWLLSVWQLK